MKRSLTYASILTVLCVVLAVVTVSLTGCSSLNVINPSYSLRSVAPRINFAIPPSLDLEFTVGVDNPNPVALRLDRFDFDVFVNNNALLRNIQSNQGVNIPARGYGDIRLTTHVNYNDIKNIYREVTELISGNRATYQIRGNAYYNTPVGQMRFPVTVSH